MALGRKCSSMKIRRPVSMNNEDDLRLEFARCTRSFGRKRIAIAKNEDDSFSVDDSIPRTPLKRFCSGRVDVGDVQEPTDESYLESLPQHILIRILCGVDHEDLKQLFHVSKSIREATVIAKKSHFAYSTPRKIQAFRSPIDCHIPNELDDIEAPNAPRQSRSYKSRLNGKNVASISMALFTSPKKGLFMETEM